MDVSDSVTVIPDVGLNDYTFFFLKTKEKIYLLLHVHSLPGTVLGTGISGKKRRNGILGLTGLGNSGGERATNNNNNKSQTNM